MAEQLKTASKWTVKDVLEWTAAYFKTRGITTARLDAEVLLAHCLETDRLHLYLNLDRPLLPSERARYREMVRRRASREPVSLIVGKKEFWSIPFRAVPGVLIPRPDTETLVMAVLDVICGNPHPEILEIGTGSGAVATAIARECPGASVIATDINLTALEAAQFNAHRAGAAVLFLAADLLDPIRSGTRFDVICSNPPYIPDHVIPTLEPEIRFEPLAALRGGMDGLDIIRNLVPQAKEYLKSTGVLLVEMDSEQDAAVKAIFSAVGLTEVTTIPDLSGKPRVTKGVMLS
ncbi:MAG TPA: peptide chain release factor N(5)-glutamine methyltransferase [Desulfomonilaceae bacterium]|nr:peptide chain release factor N(5)-glutamine methyltransferase [Desulfomonilaceae bacterium]